MKKISFGKIDVPTHIQKWDVGWNWNVFGSIQFSSMCQLCF